MPEFIRVRVKDSGTEQTIAKPTAVDPEIYEVLDEDAVDYNDRPLAPKFPDTSGHADLDEDDEDDDNAAPGDQPGPTWPPLADDNREGAL